MWAKFVAFVDGHVHTESFNILHNVLRIMEEIETLAFLGAGSLLNYLTRKAQEMRKETVVLGLVSE